ncbi:heterocyst formation ABC transporter subunit HepA [Myxosarcina sp. GI1]|uniref:heterocyst formation ABC transporter subunit HepA n=1 Tax=Myxosarcina sp. GI1 TaxID=1541065 RepID=UPI000566905F
MQRSLKFPLLLRNLVKATEFWRDNYIIVRELKHFRKIAILALTCTLLAAIFEGGTVGLIASFLQGLTNPNEPPIQTGIEWFDVRILATEATAAARIYRLSALILVTVWFRSALLYFGTYNLRLSQSNLCDRIRQRLFDQFQSLSLSYYSSSRSGELINSITNEINQLKQAIEIYSMLITRSSTMLAYVVSMFWISWQLTITALMFYFLLSVGLSKLIARVREASFAVPQANGKLTSVAIEFINGIRTVKASATQDYERRRFVRASRNIIEAEDKVAGISSSVQPIAEGVASTILIIMVIVAFNLFIVGGEFKAASLLTFMFVLFRMMPLVSQINAKRENLNRFRGTIEHLKQLLRTDDKPYLQDGKIQFSGLKQGIDFISVDFSYQPEEDLVLKNITLSIEKGKTTALVGSSGAGKSTLADLIPRFYDPTSGEILIDGVNLRRLEINSLRRRMAVVSQETFIFNNTVRYNIAYGLEDIDELKIIQAAKQSNAWSFIQSLPEGFNTILGDRGVRLSGGQRQRLAIARALLRDPEILILDEATSALDSVTERLIQESLEKLSQDRTVIAIAHRLSTIVKADKVVVLEQGHIVEQGTYEELLQQRGKLWKYHQMQHELT